MVATTTWIQSLLNQPYYLEVLKHVRDMVWDNNWKCRLQENGNSIITMHQLTQHCQFESSKQWIQFLPFYNCPIRLSCPLDNLLYSPPPPE
jgi:hypothetical protein